MLSHSPLRRCIPTTTTPLSFNAGSLRSISGAKIYGINSSRMVDLSTSKDLRAFPVWARKSELLSLGLDSIAPGVPCNNSVYFHSSHLRDAEDLARLIGSPSSRDEHPLPYIPFSQTGSVLFKEDIGAAREMATRQGFKSPYWIPTKITKALNLSIPPPQNGAGGGESRTIRAGANKELYVNAEDTADPTFFNPKTCVEYTPIMFPAPDTRLTSMDLQKLIKASDEQGFSSLVWVRQRSTGTYGLNLKLDGDRGIVDLGPKGTFVNGNCFEEEDRIYFYEMYRPVSTEMKPLRDRALFACSAYNNHISNPMWMTTSVARRTGVTFPSSAVAIEVPIGGGMIAYLSAQQCSHPELFKWSPLRAKNLRLRYAQ